MIEQALLHGLEAALAEHRAGRLEVATSLYRDLLARFPGQPHCLHFLGLALHQSGHSAEAAVRLAEAVAANPGDPDWRSNLGCALQAAGRPADAEAAFRAALAADPGHIAAQGNLGGLLVETGKPRDALPLLEAAARADPGNATVRMNLGNALRALGRFAEAEPHHAAAARAMPHSAPAHHNLATSLQSADRLDEAAEGYRRSLAIAPGLAAALVDYAMLELERQRPSAARRLAGRAVAAMPKNGEAWAIAAQAALDSGDLAAARRHVEQALAVDGASVSVRDKCAPILLALGDVARGWRLFEARLARGDATAHLGLPARWQGEPLTGRTIVICSEQGVGDELLYAALFPDVIRAARHVYIECDRRLEPMFGRSFPQATVHRRVFEVVDGSRGSRYDWLPRQPPPDRYVEAGSLALHLRPTIESYADARPYLVPDPSRLAAWRERLADRTGPKVGIVWRSRLVSTLRRAHYPMLDLWGPVFAVPGVQFVSLQYGGDWAAELAGAERRFGRPVLRFPEVDLMNDFDEALALTAALDLVITPSTTPVWLAAGLHKPTWQLQLDNWYLQLGQPGYPGFPSIRPFGRLPEEPWEPVMARVGEALARVAAEWSSDAA